VGLLFSDRDRGRLVRIEAKMKRAKYREVLDENLLRELRTSDWGEGSPSNRTMTLSTEWLRDKSLNVLEWPSQRSGLEPVQTSLERPENRCAATLPIQPDRAGESYPRRLEAVITAKGASTKY
jgi:hypothetical protein